jgi:hypothetical protein
VRCGSDPQKSSCLAADGSEFAKSQALTQAERLRLRSLAGKLFELGPSPIFHFLTDIKSGEPLRPTLELCASLPADLVKAYRGDVFLPRAFAIGAGE